MASTTSTPQPLAGWFKWAAIASLLWMLLGCGMYLFEVTLDPATLPADQRSMIEAIPSWMWAAFAIAVWVGLAGALLLVLRNKLAVPLLTISLVAMLVQNSAYVVDQGLRESVPLSTFTLDTATSRATPSPCPASG
jgi:hypothetical protein